MAAASRVRRTPTAHAPGLTGYWSLVGPPRAAPSKQNQLIPYHLSETEYRDETLADIR